MKVTFDASPNIALVKYWGKRDEKLMLPCEGSISVTMDFMPEQSIDFEGQEEIQLRTRTTIEFSKSFEKDEMILNDSKVERKEFGQIIRIVNNAREKAGIKEKVKIVSKNYFPTAAGIASSSSGYAALALALNECLDLKLSFEGISIQARLGSGSACRSVLGGFVEWKKGKLEDGSDSIAVQIKDELFWPEFRNIIVITEKEKKRISSRAGMKQTVETSELFKQRLKILPKRLKECKEAILKRDFRFLGKRIMQDSNNMHACMLDTYPAIIYLNDISREVMHKIHELNESRKKIVGAYSFDAGPNAHIFCLKSDVDDIIRNVREIGGIRKILVCRVGARPVPSNEHLF